MGKPKNHDFYLLEVVYMRTALVTGAAGLFGAHMSRHLLEEGFRVVGIDNLEGGYREFLPEDDDFYFLKCDLNDFKTIGSLFEKFQPEVVFHFAAYAAEGLSPFIRRFNYENNILGSASIINNCISYDAKLVFTSSMGVYGNQVPPFTEAMLPQPIDPYGIAKYAVELDLKAAHEQFGLRYSIVRPHNVVGPFQNVWDKYRNVLGIFVRKALADEDLVVYGSGHQTRAFSDIAFYMDPLAQLIDNFDSEIFNIGADQEIQILELANLVVEEARRHGKVAKIVFAEERLEVPFAFCDHTKAKKLLRFKDNTNMVQLIEKMFNWVSLEPAREVKSMDYEIHKNLYSYWQ